MTECFGLGVEEASALVNALRILAYCSHRSSEMRLCLHCIIISITHLCLAFVIKDFLLPPPVKTCVTNLLNVCREMDHYVFRYYEYPVRLLLQFREAVELTHQSAKPLSTCLNFIHLRMH